MGREKAACAAQGGEQQQGSPAVAKRPQTADERSSSTPNLPDSTAARPMGKWKPYRSGNSTDCKRDLMSRDVASWSYFGSTLLNAAEPYQWEVEDYENAVQYKRENMGQWWTTKAQ